MRNLVLASILLAANAGAHAQHPVVNGVTSLAQDGGHSPIIADDPAWTGLVAGGTSSWISTPCGERTLSGPAPLVAAARSWGSGRIIFTSRDWSSNLGSNATFRLNAAQWLANGRPGPLVWTTGHQEWHGSSSASVLPSLASSLGRASYGLSGTVTSNSLASIAVLYVLDPWASFTEAERAAIMQWVNNGGGLWVTALGWSWNAYHPGTTSESDHPGTKLLSGTGAYAARSNITWSSGLPQVFDRFGANAHSGSVAIARDALVALHTQYPTGIGPALEQDAALRTSFVNAHSVIAWGNQLGLPASRTQAARDACNQLRTSFPTSYNRGGAWPLAQPTALRGRERLWRTFTDLTPDTVADRTAVAALANWTGVRLAIYRDYGTVLVDDQRSSALQQQSILAWMQAIPAGRVALDAITFSQWLPAGQTPLDLTGPGCQVNVFNNAVGSASENPFPADSPARACDLFTSVAAHEVMHAVDATWITPNAAFDARRDALIADAGTDPNNYLRSMFTTGFFVDAPQEFVASMANQWVSEGYLVMRLGRTRFAAGRRQPIEQALFMADVFANGTTTTFFRGTTTGAPIARSVHLTRDGSGRITSLRDGTTTFQIGYGSDGHVLSVTETSDDCNANGIADALDILTGGVADANADMIPDACVCPQDIDRNGSVDGGDLAILLGAWGTASTSTDLDRNGITDAADLSVLLAAWGPCTS